MIHTLYSEYTSVNIGDRDTGSIWEIEDLNILWTHKKLRKYIFKRGNPIIDKLAILYIIGGELGPCDNAKYKYGLYIDWKSDIPIRGSTPNHPYVKSLLDTIDPSWNESYIIKYMENLFNRLGYNYEEHSSYCESHQSYTIWYIILLLVIIILTLIVTFMVF
jgi:hypothetical protein